VAERLQAAVLVLVGMAGLPGGNAAESGGVPGPADNGGARLAAVIIEPVLDEISGLAQSRRDPELLWTHNDSGDAAQIYAIGSDGVLRATLRLNGVRHVDFEDIAAFELDGEPYLMVGDVGDNGGVRREMQLHVLREPEVAVDGAVDVAWTIRFRWPDGPRDCEAIAVDPHRGEVLLASKKRVPAELFRLPLRPPPQSEGRLQVAERIGLFAGIAQPSAEELAQNPIYGRYRAQVTAIDLSPDGRRLVVLTYRQAYLYDRGANEGWGRAVRRPPRGLVLPWLAQAEAIAFDREATTIWVSSERLPAPLLRLTLPAPR
jgi:hypothetical protein